MIEEFKKILKRLGPLGIFIFPILIIIILLFFALSSAGIIGGNRAIKPNDISDNSYDYSNEDPGKYKSLYPGENNEEVKVEIADSLDEWEKGLMFRTNLDENRGMLFVFPDEFQRSFWMKNTYVSLDIIFMDEDGIVLNFFESAEPLNETKTYESSGGAKYVLELKAGTVERLKITGGEKIEI